MKAENKPTLKIEGKNQSEQLSDFEKAQRAVISIGYKIKEHQAHISNISKLIRLDVSENANDYQYVMIQDAERADFRIKQPVLIKELIQFLIVKSQEEAKKLEQAILNDTIKTIDKAA